ncbi:MAG: hypothetical protein HC880_08325 [Bacteroidia bacterium]|nr:hypothetical protein [Bacteroidia bacterium]
MRFQITFAIRGRQRRLSYHYQYPLSAWIYRVLQRADDEYSSFLHELGYAALGKKFKFFTFSSLDLASFRLTPEGILLQGEQIRLVVSFCLDAAAEKFITGLFQNQELTLATATRRYNWP